MAIEFTIILIGIFIGVALIIAQYLHIGYLATHVGTLESSIKELANTIKVDDVILEDYDKHSCSNAETCERFEHHTCPYLKDFKGLIFRSKDEVPENKRPDKVTADKLRP